MRFDALVKGDAVAVVRLGPYGEFEILAPPSAEEILEAEEALSLLIQALVTMAAKDAGWGCAAQADLEMGKK